MSDWQSEGIPQEPESNRVRWAGQLVSALEQLEEKFIMGTLPRDEFHAELSELNDRLSVVGLSLANKPWVTKTGGNRL